MDFVDNKKEEKPLNIFIFALFQFCFNSFCFKFDVTVSKFVISNAIHTRISILYKIKVTFVYYYHIYFFNS